MHGIYLNSHATSASVNVGRAGFENLRFFFAPSTVRLYAHRWFVHSPPTQTLFDRRGVTACMENAAETDGWMAG